ncbi:glycosyltransferase family 2 protein [Alkalicoccobacillus murimartini]|uniref:GT2 family glycosyltransferase n=1 Tax=Alkalicoccobacillus murimartini TaxID=171685 RepID=A0ABT9YGD0_9BACI|nr:glycosyltransferase family 2 protein [Alkalicoccobacillus murimartini]MDQ0206916.1 GT2 family glycosyltransferase [Alkalicoccobacillus murimartini]
MTQSVAIILLNWNSYKDTKECMESLELLDYATYHVYVVDNASTDGSAERLKKDDQEALYSFEWTFLASPRNLGFAGGNNIAIKQASIEGFDFIWLLNNDTEVEAQSLSTLVEPMLVDHTIGITGSKIYFANSDVIWFAGGKINARNGAHAHIGMRKKDQGQFDQKKDVNYIVGCSLLIRSEIVQEIGVLEEDYFLYYEDVDWNLRALEKGWRIQYIPTSIIWHKVSQSIKSSELSALSTYYIIRNAYVMAVKFHEKPFQVRACLRLGRNIIWYHLKIIIRKQDHKRRRSALIFAAAGDALKGKTGQFVQQKTKMRTTYGTRKSS